LKNFIQAVFTGLFATVSKISGVLKLKFGVLIFSFFLNVFLSLYCNDYALFATLNKFLAVSNVVALVGLNVTGYTHIGKVNFSAALFIVTIVVVLSICCAVAFNLVGVNDQAPPISILTVIFPVYFVSRLGLEILKHKGDLVLYEFLNSLFRLIAFTIAFFVIRGIWQSWLLSLGLYSVVMCYVAYVNIPKPAWEKEPKAKNSSVRVVIGEGVNALSTSGIALIVASLPVLTLAAHGYREMVELVAIVEFIVLPIELPLFASNLNLTKVLKEYKHGAVLREQVNGRLREVNVQNIKLSLMISCASLIVLVAYGFVKAPEWHAYIISFGILAVTRIFSVASGSNLLIFNLIASGASGSITRRGTATVVLAMVALGFLWAKTNPIWILAFASMASIFLNVTYVRSCRRMGINPALYG